jgi:ferredoxin
MGTGPAVDRAPVVPDVRVTELLDGSRHEFVCRAGTEAGAELLADIARRPATDDDRRACEEQAVQAVAAMGRSMVTSGLRPALQATLDHPHWDDVAARCLSCANCTLVCPTCFCSTVEDTTDLAGTEATRTRVWDSCFTLGHSHVHGGAVHPDVRSRYRQWLTHKLDTWWDQFDTGGCVGCGRCVTWCPAGIDLTVEAAALVRAAERAMVGAGVDREGAS